MLESVGCGGRIGTEVSGDKIILCCLGDRGAEITYHDIEKERGGHKATGTYAVRVLHSPYTLLVRG